MVRYEITRTEMQGYSNSAREEMFRLYPDMRDWWFRKPGQMDDEIIFTDADTGRTWSFGEVSALNSAEKERLKAMRPDVYRAYSGRLFRDVVIPPEYRV